MTERLRAGGGWRRYLWPALGALVAATVVALVAPVITGLFADGEDFSGLLPALLVRVVVQTAALGIGAIVGARYGCCPSPFAIGYFAMPIYALLVFLVAFGLPPELEWRWNLVWLMPVPAVLLSSALVQLRIVDLGL